MAKSIEDLYEDADLETVREALERSEISALVASSWASNGYEGHLLDAVATVVAGLRDNTEKNDCGYDGWSAEEAVSTYLQFENGDPIVLDQDQYDQVTQAVGGVLAHLCRTFPSVASTMKR